MRAIKFRGRVEDTGEWIIGDLAHYYDGNCAISLDGGYSIHVISESIGQFTGRYDKSGKEIYEGDIISFDDGHETESGYCENWGCGGGKVFWDEETAAFCVTGRDSCESYEALADCEVIGNIYDNPELLEEKDK